MTNVKNAISIYTIHTINGISPKENDLSVLNQKLDIIDNYLKSLNDQSTNQQIIELNEKNVFNDKIYSALVKKIADEQFVSKKQDIDNQIKHYNGILESNLVNEAIDAFETKLVNYSSATYRETKQAFDNVFEVKTDNLSEEQKTAFNNRKSALKDKNNYKQFIGDYTDDYVNSFESNVENGKINSLDNYMKVKNIESIWSEYKERVNLNVLENNKIEEFDSRIRTLKSSLTGSIYDDFWRQGDTWNAIEKDYGLYVTGLGAYGQALGYNQKLEVGVDSEIKFNIIYAFRRLGANHLHIGFYPKTNTATLGDADGVRIDFWFAGTVIEVQPVNGRTETTIYDAAYLTIQDTGFFEEEDPDYEMGSYDVKLLKNGNQLSISVNNYEMDITGLDASLYNNGCYLTVSTMSYEGLDWNELVITSIGNRSFIKSQEEPSQPEDNKEPEEKKEKGCKSQVSFISLIGLFTLLTLVAIRKRKEVI